MTEATQGSKTGSERRRGTGALLLAAGGITAAFGAASCCALPILFGSLGLGSAWLATVAWFAAPHRIALLIVATASLASGGTLFFWPRCRSAGAAEGGACRTPAKSALVAVLLAFGGLLVALGYLYA